ncbi:hypothetical protein E4U51_005815 [Claviceps purpurea]|nr:hypothetical protein E4U51_005815 [Claviceps purpurea]
MCFKKPSLRRAFLLILFLVIIAYTINKFHGLSADDALLRSLYTPFDAKSPELGNELPSTVEYIPRIIHQTYKTNTLPEAWVEPYQTCLYFNPEDKWRRVLWTDETSRDFIRDFYPSFLPTYDGYPYNIQRVDAFRYFVLHYYGGIYLDLDIGCKKDLSPLLKQHAFFAKTEPHGVSNDVMGMERGHPVFANIVAALQENDYRRGTKYPTVMMSTGPLFVTNLLLDFLKSRLHGQVAGSQQSQPPEALVAILPPVLYGTSPYSYFRHYEGSTWHSWDARLVLAISRRPVLFVVGVLLSFASCTWIRYRRRVPRRSYASVAAEV